MGSEMCIRDRSAKGIPQIAVVMGSCTAGGAYVPAMSDVTIIVKNQGTIFLAGPPLVKAATGEVVDAEDLGGGDIHTSSSGVADYLADDDHQALAMARRAIKNLNRKHPEPVKLIEAKEPDYDPNEIIGIVPHDLRTSMMCVRLLLDWWMHLNLMSLNPDLAKRL